MTNQFERTELLTGKDGLEILRDSHVAVFGIGGVGGYVVEALVRCGIGKIDLIDNDDVSISNINRQIIATHSTIGRSKVDVAGERISDINPDVKVRTFKTFYTPETKEQFNFSEYDYVIDAIDTVTGKISLVEETKKAGVPIICSMGTGNKMHPEMLEIADISKTSVCPLARVMRTELKKRKIKDVKVVYSKEEPIDVPKVADEKNHKRQVPGSNSFVPPTAGLIIASEVVRDLIKYKQ